MFLILRSFAQNNEEVKLKFYTKPVLSFWFWLIFLFPLFPDEFLMPRDSPPDENRCNRFSGFSQWKVQVLYQMIKMLVFSFVWLSHMLWYFWGMVCETVREFFVRDLRSSRSYLNNVVNNTNLSFAVAMRFLYCSNSSSSSSVLQSSI